MKNKIYQKLVGASLDKDSIVTEAMSLWDGSVPLQKGDDLIDKPTLSVHLPDASNSTGCGVVVNPGGGYRSLASDHEGLQVAKWFNRIGIAAFVLRYRLGPKYTTDVSLVDGVRALKLIRFFAEHFGVDKDRLGMLGFSAGGHLACNVGVRHSSFISEDPDAIERESGRPDFVVPVYAVTNGEKRGRKANEYIAIDSEVAADTPPMFIVHNHEDSIVPASQSTLLYDALLKVGVNAELHIFNDGDHGLGLAAGDPDSGQWTELLKRWLVRRGFMTSKERLQVKGRVLLDNQAMALAWVSFLPEDANQPIARTRISHHSDGYFSISETDGPTAGPHVMEVIYESAQGEPSMTGIYTLQDSQKYHKRVTVSEGLNIELSLSKGELVIA